MSAFNKLLSILDLFTEQTPYLTAEQIGTQLECSASTAYRYVRELLAVGLLAKRVSGEYVLGPRIIRLDYQIRNTDPVLSIAQPIMAELVERVGFDVVISHWFGEEFVDTHRETKDTSLALKYGRGRPRLLFKGAAPKAVMSTFPRARLLTLYESHEPQIRASGMAQTFDEFRAALWTVRKEGYYISEGEVEPDVVAIAVPVYSDNSGVASAALQIVMPLSRLEFVNRARLVEALKEAAARIGARLSGAD
ncbi:IclR family transcriptional regulator [Pararobbsia silviterrae]|uniref:IclR family transcriptional regulator n=1 Tax=Pararobbsia silviterrae TaxID=1792498 RepID=A0A494X9F4_9BURK|nr:IclR family transcriptional regulator [Pararobbsia silviterrae]RKP47148.1 IclR family transcriptional regulator [Pararobbsia silviterrae]